MIADSAVAGAYAPPARHSAIPPRETPDEVLGARALQLHQPEPGQRVEEGGFRSPGTPLRDPHLHRFGRVRG